MQQLGDIKGTLFQPPDILRPSEYDSPLEHRFAHHAAKYLKLGLELQPQVNVDTRDGRYRLDFIVAVDEVSTAFECDGAEWHGSLDLFVRDKERDEAILATGAIQTIYRLRGRDLTYRPEDCFYAISRWNPELFSARGLANLEHLASPEIRRYNRFGSNSDGVDLRIHDIDSGRTFSFDLYRRYRRS